MQRRKLLAGIGGVVIALGHLPALAAEPSRHLSLQRAQAISAEILAQQQVPGHDSYTDDLDLVDYKSADLDALEHLTHLSVETVSLGFAFISADMAEIICRWSLGWLYFNGLTALCEDAAKHFGTSAGGVALCFMRPLHLSTTAIEALGTNFGLLTLNWDRMPDRFEAKALAGQQEELHLNLPKGSLSLAAAAMLSNHAGSRLTLSMPDEPSERLLQKIASNPNKRLGVRPPGELNRSTGRIGVPRPKWWVSLSDRDAPLKS